MPNEEIRAYYLDPDGRHPMPGIETVEGQRYHLPWADVQVDRENDVVEFSGGSDGVETRLVVRDRDARGSTLSRTSVGPDDRIHFYLGRRGRVFLVRNRNVEFEIARD